MGKIVFAHPLWLWACFLVVPAVLFMWIKTARMDSKTIRIRVRLRSLFFSIAWINLVVAASGISWGSYLVGVQKSSSAVAMVFDVSNSMMAKDTKSGNTRLKSAAEYAGLLMERSEAASFSVILAKGDGITAVPLTQDYQLIGSLLEVLSPSLMSAPGTSLAKGIEAALDSFPENFSYAPHIWVFTDGEETDSRLESGMELCIEKGVPLTIIGFGSIAGCDVLSGDGSTVIHSSLKKTEVLESIEKCRAKNQRKFAQVPCAFVEAEEKGSAASLLNPLKGLNGAGNKNEVYSAFESRERPRYKIFLGFALLWLTGGLFVSEKRRKSSLTAALMVMVLFTGCSGILSKSEAKSTVASGNFSYHNSNYHTATARYKTVLNQYENENDFSVYDYALFNLGTTYLMEGETAAALEKYNQISSTADEKIIFAVLYNRGVISYESGDFATARNFFKEALKINSTDLQAKINLELCISKNESLGKQNESLMSGASENHNKNSGTDSSLFEHMKENDRKQWKNAESTSDTDLSQDY